MNVHRIGPTTLRLEHRALTVADAEFFFRLNSHPDVMRFTGEPPLGSVDEARDALAHYPDFEEHGYGRWGCVLRETGALIGFCGLKRLTDLGEVDIGYRFLPEFWGRGLATEACSACLGFGFDTLGLERIIALVMPGNAASVRVLEKCSMRPDGEIEYCGTRALRFVAEPGDLAGPV